MRDNYSIGFSVIVVAFLTPAANAQALFTTGKGDSSVSIRNGSFLRANFGDSSLQLGYQYVPRFSLNGGQPTSGNAGIELPATKHLRAFPRFGFQVEAKPKDGIGSVFTADNLSINGRITASFGLDRLASYTRSALEITAAGDEQQVIEKGVSGILALITKEQELLNKAKLEQVNLPKEIEDERKKIEDKQKELSTTTDPLRRAQIPLEIVDSEQKIKVKTERIEALKTEIPRIEQEIKHRTDLATMAKDKNYLVPLATEVANVGKLLFEINDLKSQLKGLTEGDSRREAIEKQIADKQKELDRQAPALKNRKKALENNVNPPNGPHGMAYDWAFLSVSYTRASFSLLKSEEATKLKDKYTDRKFDGYSVSGSYNAYFDKARIPLLVGFTLGAQSGNNASGLSKTTIEESTPAKDNANLRTISTKEVLKGEYKPYWEYIFNTDFILQPKQLDSRVLFDIFLRSRIRNKSLTGEPGVGIFLTDPKSPTQVFGGLTVAGARDEKERPVKVNLVTGFNF